jgi:glycosyltransferase involved in cell wall biosynthesis
VRVAFLLNDLQLSGGVGVVVQHASRLSQLEDWDLTLVLVRQEEGRSWRGYEHLPHLHVLSRDEAIGQRYDIAVATWWETAFSLFELPADRYAFFVQSLEDRFYEPHEGERLGASLPLGLPVAFITEARWIADTIAALRPDAPAHLVPNGIDKEIFGPLASVPNAAAGPLRVLIEGSPASWFKGVHSAIHAVGAMREPRHVTVVTGERAALGEIAASAVDAVVGPLDHAEMAQLYEQTDVLLKLSSVEGMFGPPLEGFHRGATCVVTPVTGYDEYVVHGWNGLITDWDDLRGTARQLDLLARDRRLLAFLRTNALETARSWPSWRDSSELMAAALLAVRDAPAPDAAPAAARLLADLRGGLELNGKLLRERSEFERRARRIERMLRHPLARVLLRVRRNRAAQIALRPLRPIYRRTRSALR